MIFHYGVYGVGVILRFYDLFSVKMKMEVLSFIISENDNGNRSYVDFNL